MKKTAFLLGAAVVALTAGSAAAADLAVKARPAPVVAPLFSWTGCYVGVHGGGGAVRSPFLSEGSGSWGNGGLAGGQIGCNYQTGVFVFGVEGEGYWSGMKASREFANLNVGEGSFNNAEVRNKYDYTVAGRIGVNYERAFIYGKAGWAWGRFDFFEQSSGCQTCAVFTTTGSETLNGPLFGLGIEYALTQNWTVKGEYNYINYGLSPVNFVETGCSAGLCLTPNLTRSSFSAEKHIFKFGVNYLFNFGGPAVVAKY